MSEPVLDDLIRMCRERPPETALVLGSGLGPVADRFVPLLCLPFSQIPGLPRTSVHGHRGQVRLARGGDCTVLIFEGRLHFYEGHSRETVGRMMNLAADLGTRSAILTNAAGGIRDDLVPGSLMLLSHHLLWNVQPPQSQVLGPSPYSDPLRERFRLAATGLGLRLAEGVYAAVTGPCYETPAEIRALRTCCADAVGMSTTFEVLAARERGLECGAISLITNRGAGLSDAPLHHEEVLETARATSERLGDLLVAVLK